MLYHTYKETPSLKCRINRSLLVVVGYIIPQCLYTLKSDGDPQAPKRWPLDRVRSGVEASIHQLCLTTSR